MELNFSIILNLYLILSSSKKFTSHTIVTFYSWHKTFINFWNFHPNLLNISPRKSLNKKIHSLVAKINIFSLKHLVKPNKFRLFHPFRPYLILQAWSRQTPDDKYETRCWTPFCVTDRWSPVLLTGDRFFGARSAYVEHLMAVTRWPGARPSHAAVTSRLIAIVPACMHASLKLVWGHMCLCVCACVSVARTEQTHVYWSEPLSSQSANSSMLFWCLRQ